MTGASISHYQVLDKLGEGGMGVVYKARDTHLDRFVALKVLPADRVADADRRLRFVQEAKAASALNHPNIVTIYDIDSADGVHFIAMEYVAGKTLDRLIGRKGLKLGEALQYAVQMADALAKAHAAGIVHRDVKPSNVMVTDEGVVKVLDFGLAKLTEAVGPEDETATVRTAEGMIVGTAAYMSPEQAEGKPLDARSDIFSFGSVLYEMLTGQRAFEGATKVSTLAAILHGQPKPPGTLPGEVGRVLQRCLKKEPQRRFQTMSDLKVALEELKEESDSGTLSAQPGVIPRPRRWPLALATAALVLVAAWLWFPRTAHAPAELRLSKFTFDTGLTTDAAISPDGKLAAYASDRSGEGNLDIWVQHVAGRQPIRLTRHEADDRFPAFSPDGSRIVFQSERDGGGLYLVDVLGGEERKIVDRGWAPRFSTDGAWISYIDVPAYPGFAKMYVVPASGGPPKPFLPEYGVIQPPQSMGPVWSPDSKFLLFKGSNGQVLDWWVAPVEGGAPVATGAERSFSDLGVIRAPAVWLRDGVIFSAGVTTEGVNLFRAALGGNWRLAGPAARLSSGTGILFSGPPSRDGRMLVTNLSWVPSHWSLPLNASQGTASGPPQQVTHEGVAKLSASLSRDGSKLAYLVLASFGIRRVEVRVRDLASSRETVIPVGSIRLDQPVLSADGTVVAYSDLSAGKRAFFAASVGGTAPRRICEECTVFGFFSDSNLACVLYPGNRLVRKNLATGEELALGKATGGQIFDARPSWDDRWLAVLAGKPDGRAEILVGRDQEWVAVAEDARALACPRWSPDGHVLYYLSGRDGHICVWAQRLDAATRKPAGEPWPVHHVHTTRLSFLGPPAQRAFEVARDKAMLLLNETTGNVWTAMLGEP